jgi:manganese/zinc/iron transport system permease protein
MISAQILLIMGGCMLAAFLLALSGIPTYLRRESLTGDALSHAIFPGVVLAVWISGANAGWTIYVFGILVGIIALFLIQTIHQKTIIPKDGATGIVLIVFFSVGLLLMGRLQRSGFPLWGIQHVLLGKAATILPNDLAVLGILALLASLLFFTFQKWIWAEAFDAKFAYHSGLPKLGYALFLNGWTAMVLTASIQILGAVLSAALLLTPAALGHFLSPNPRNLMLTAVSSAILSALFAGAISAFLPAMSTGALLVIMLFIISFPLFLFHPQKGVAMKWLARKKEARRWTDENTLKFLNSRTESNEKMEVSPSVLRLIKQGFVAQKGAGVYALTPLGNQKAERIIRKHRLWETFLHQRLLVPEGRVHDNAELMEHLLDDEAEDQLAKELNNPSSDPHSSPIPPKKS